MSCDRFRFGDVFLSKITNGGSLDPSLTTQRLIVTSFFSCSAVLLLISVASLLSTVFSRDRSHFIEDFYLIIRHIFFYLSGTDSDLGHLKLLVFG